MKKINFIVLTALFSFFLFSCTKEFEEINTNKNKFYDVDANSLFPGTVSRTMKLIGELNYNKLLNFSRYGVVNWATNPSQDIGDSYYNQFYVGIIRDLESLERSYSGKPDFQNRLAIVKTWKSYMYYMLASIYGSVPMSEAIADGSENKRSYKYDTEQDIYTNILNSLAEAGALYNIASPAKGDYLTTDPVFGIGSYGNSDLVKWQKFTNTLRLNIALHVQNISMDLAREHALAVMQDESKLISSVTDIVKLQWGKDADMSASFYFNRFKGQTTFSESTYPGINEYFAIYLFSYNDPRIASYAQLGNAMAPANTAPFMYTDTLTRKHADFCRNVPSDSEHYCTSYAQHQDGLNNLRIDSILVDYTMPYVPLVEGNSLAFGWEWEYVPGRDYRYSDPLTRKSSPYNYSFVHNDFLKEDASLVLLNWADACFLKAEAEMLFGSPAKAQQYYEDGIRASFAQYGLSSSVDDYMAQDGIKWNTSGRGYADRRLLYRANINGNGGKDNHLEQIYKQRYFAGFFNGLEGWNLERRTRVLRFPPFFANGAASDVEGYNSVYNYWTERFIYPLVEQNKNQEAYYQGIENLKAVSPYYRGDRWGDNVYTSLGFSKLNPDIAIANYLWGGNKRLRSNAEYFNKKYGENYEEVVLTAKQMTGDSDARTALKKAFNFNFRQLLKTYIP